MASIRWEFPCHQTDQVQSRATRTNEDAHLLNHLSTTEPSIGQHGALMIVIGREEVLMKMCTGKRPQNGTVKNRDRRKAVKGNEANEEKVFPSDTLCFWRCPPRFNQIWYDQLPEVGVREQRHLSRARVGLLDVLITNDSSVIQFCVQMVPQWSVWVVNVYWGY